MGEGRLSSPISANLVVTPMHGEVKVRPEGLRTRDGHLIEWLATMLDDMVVVSRPEPFPRLRLARLRHRGPLRPSVRWVSPEVLAPAAVLRGRRWWRDSVRWLPEITDGGGLIAWNPFAAAHYAERTPNRALVFDFLDDWLIHPAFQPLHSEVDRAYREICDSAVAVFCNSEGTLERAHHYGRTDATLMPNGCDPERFEVADRRSGDQTVIGYAGKLGSRIDFDLIEAATERLPACRFVIAGPSMDRATSARLKRIRADVLGDVHYDDYPALLASFDIGWVPHKVGEGEVGGDAIKIYEYCATGLPTFSTPIIGASRLPSVRVLGGSDLLDGMATHIAEQDGPRVPREHAPIASEHRWQSKAAALLEPIAERLGSP